MVLILAAACLFSCAPAEEQNFRVATFTVSATPAIGVPVAYAKTRSIADSLTVKGVVIYSDQKPVVLCAVDWLGIANEGLDAWRNSLAEAAGTTPDQVSVHALHQHDGARCDYTTARILSNYGLGGWRYDTAFMSQTILKAASALKRAKSEAKSITHMGYGQAVVDRVASNRRILGEDGQVSITRWSSTTDSAAIAAEEGLIDPWLKCVSFWDENKPVVALYYYTTHPMSHYGQGDVSADFVGIARENREKDLGFTQVYFSGAGGNITAGKYNDGSPENRYVLSDRVETAMKESWDSQVKVPIGQSDLQWYTAKVALPLGDHLVEEELIDQLESEETDSLEKFTAAKHLAWLYRTREGNPITVSALNLKNVWLLNLPGELFVEYQLSAQQMRPDGFVCTAAYEEYGPGYIGTNISYSQGGYESSARASRVGPGVEEVLMDAIKNVLNATN
ncbi:MAG: hypothetical protein DHS20C17_09160 [Cyclobacteriaceae bacterium]|nr:MAG: hypothetical protein DHS20C17_09160 [Cyclobacteriaceae bacterium]